MNTQEYITALREALDFLCDLKAYKDAHGEDDYCEMRQRDAWRKAHQVLSLPVPTVSVERAARAITREIKNQDRVGYVSDYNLGDVTIDSSDIDMLCVAKAAIETCGLKGGL